ncbi:MAG: energy transducer TonB [Flavobacteriaceae bacterium]
MKLKKNPNADLRKNSSLYFVIGLCLMLFITWRAIEWKSYEKTNFDYQALDVNTEEDDDIPITEQINKHVKKHFRYPEIAQEMGIQGRVLTTFIIDKDGTITNIQMRGPDKNLEVEAKRIISLLPQMIPGKQRGRPVRVPFSIPITFRLQ